MLDQIKLYCFYSISDINKEPIDKVLTVSEESALQYFAERKKIDEETFLKLYKIDIYAQTKPK